MAIDKSRLVLRRYPFVRYVRCRCCTDRAATPFEEFYTWKAYQFHLGPRGEFAGTCPKTGERQVWSAVDVIDYAAGLENYTPWRPEELEEHIDPFTDTRVWIWAIPNDFARDVMVRSDRQLGLLSTTPRTILQAVFLKQKFRFNDGALSAYFTDDTEA